MSTEIEDMAEKTAPFSLLYVEDDPNVQETMLRLLQLLFAKIDTAADGVEGLEQFEKHKPDMVITDIQMPRMNGIEMSKAIKETNPDVPVIITTAYNDEEYFLQAIAGQVDAFLIKPVSREKIVEVLSKIATLLENRRKAHELDRIRQIEAINRASEEAIRELSDLFPYPAFFYKSESLHYVNAPAQGVLTQADLSAMTQESEFLAQFGMFKKGNKKIHLKLLKGGKKIYWVHSSEMQIGSGEELFQAYIFIDITMLEYQKLKLNNYAFHMHEMQKERLQKPKDTFTEPVQILEPDLPEKETEPSRILTQEEQAMLRKSLYNKITAADYAKELTPDIIMEVDELKELEDEMEDMLFAFSVTADKGILVEISNGLLKYAKTLEHLYEFQDLGTAIEKTAYLLQELEPDSGKAKMIFVFLKSLSEDLGEWRKHIFVTRDAKDIHYLDSSLFSSCLQMELEFSVAKAEDDTDNDLELF